MTGDHIRQRLAQTLAAHQPVLYGVDHRARCLGCGWVGTEARGEPERHHAAALEPIVRDLIADELDVVVNEFRARLGSGGGYGKKLQARAAAVRARTEETT